MIKHLQIADNAPGTAVEQGYGYSDAVSVASCSRLGLSLSGSFSGAVIFEAQVTPAGDWVAIVGWEPDAPGTLVSQAAGDGEFIFDVEGCYGFRLSLRSAEGEVTAFVTLFTYY